MPSDTIDKIVAGSAYHNQLHYQETPPPPPSPPKLQTIFPCHALREYS